MVNLRQLIESNPALMSQAQVGEYAAVAAALNATGSETQPNPVAEAPLIPVQHSLEGFMARAEPLNPGVSAAITAKYGMPFLQELGRLLDAQDPRIANWIAIIAEDLGPACVAEAQAMLAETQPDPSWSATITVATPSLAQQHGLGRVTAKQVQWAMNDLD